MSMAVPTCAENWKCPLLLCIMQVSCCQTNKNKIKRCQKERRNCVLWVYSMTLSLLQKDTQDAVCASDCKDHVGIVVCCKHYPVCRCFADLLLLQHALCWLNSVQDGPSALQCSLLLMYLLLCIVKPLACQQSPPDTHSHKGPYEHLPPCPCLSFAGTNSQQQPC